MENDILGDMDFISDEEFMKIVNKIAPAFEEIRNDIWLLKKENSTQCNNILADSYGKKQVTKYATVGAAAAAPSAFPGIGTLAQIAIEASSLTIELTLMLRWMATSCYGIGLIYNKNIEKDFKKEFYKVLGVWSGVLDFTKNVQQDGYLANTGKEISKEILKSIAKTIVKSYIKRKFTKGLGRLIPFGVGAVFGATANYQTMDGFTKACKKYFRGADKVIEIK